MLDDKQKPTDEKPKQTSGGPGPLAIWGSLISLFVICKLVEIEDKALATEIFKYGLILWLVGVVLSFIVGRSVRETKDNALGCGYIILIGIAFIIAAMIFGSLLPSSCSDSPSDLPHYRK
jgi:hypothetical protein